MASNTRFKNSLDCIDLLCDQLVHLLPRFVRRFRNSQELRVEASPGDLRKILRILGAVAAFRGKKRATEKQFTSQSLAAIETLPQFQEIIYLVTGAAHRGDS